MANSALESLINQTKAPTQQDYNWYRNQQIAKGIFAAGLTVGGAGLCYIAIAYDNGDPLNAIITTCAGTILGGALHLIPYRETLNPENKDKKEFTRVGRALDFTKDKIINYSATFFIVATQIYINLPQPRWAHRFVYGSFNGILGLQVATMVDSFFYMKLKDDETEILDIGTTERKMEMLSGNDPLSRRSFEVIKAVVGIGALLLGHFYPPATVAPKLGMILLGNVTGVAFHEVVHAAKKYYEKKESGIPDDESPFLPAGTSYSLPHKILIYVEKTEQVVGLFLPGFTLAFNTSATDFFAGAFYGMKRQIDWIRITKTPFSKLEELQRRPEPDPYPTLSKIMTVAKWLFAIGAVGGFLGYGIYQGIADGPLVDVFALSTVAIVLYSSYFLARWMDHQKLPSSRLYNSLFFLTNYSLSPPLLFYAITQVLLIGDIALKDYGLYKIILSCFAYASLAYSFGTEAGRRATDKRISYPAEVGPLVMLYTAFLTQQLLTKD
ncbi:MAG: hypothetical protein H7A38_01675 [Chlamydiales bacterium]|nr:hypothetical protein [Chlamydiales bacterium]